MKDFRFLCFHVLQSLFSILQFPFIVSICCYYDVYNLEVTESTFYIYVFMILISCISFFMLLITLYNLFLSLFEYIKYLYNKSLQKKNDILLKMILDKQYEYCYKCRHGLNVKSDIKE